MMRRSTSALLAALLTVVLFAHASSSSAQIPGTPLLGNDQFGGLEPTSGVIDGGDALYGTTALGGQFCRGATSTTQIPGCGVVYRLTRDGDFRLLHSFSGSDGSSPTSGVIEGEDGYLYGTTDRGGVNGRGVIYRIQRDGSDFKVLYDFTAGVKHGPLTAGTGGVLYGVAPAPGGYDTDSSIFSLTPTGTYATLHDFGPNTEMQTPLLIRPYDGKIFGIVFGEHGSCGGTFITFSTSGEYHEIPIRGLSAPEPPCDAPALPRSPLMLAPDGAFYGSTLQSIVRITAGGAASIIYSLPQDERFRSSPMPWLASSFVDSLSFDASQDFYGVVSGELGTSCGSVFRLSNDDKYTPLAIFALKGDPCYRPNVIPFDAFSSDMHLLVMADGGVVGTSAGGLTCGSNTTGVFFERSCGAVYQIAGGHLTILHTFSEPPTAAQLNAVTANEIQPIVDVKPSATDDGLRITVAVEDEAEDVKAWNPSALSIAVLPTDAPTGTPAIDLRPVERPASQVPVDQAVSFDVDTIAAGMYDLVGQPPSDLIRDVVGRPVKFHGPYPTRFYVPPAPDRSPSLSVGQQFVATPDLVLDPMTDVDGNSLGTRLLTLTSVDRPVGKPATLSLSVEGSTTPIRFETNATEAVALPGLVPLVDDANVRALRAEYDGRRVFPFGTVPVECVMADGTSQTTGFSWSIPLRVVDVRRLVTTTGEWAIGLEDHRGIDRDSNYVSIDPVIVLFAPPAHQAIWGAKECIGAHAEFSDRWDAERSLGFESPAAHKEWPKALRAAVLQRQIRKGMTFEMVAAVDGYPSTYGTVADMHKLDTWYYDDVAPFAFTVKFKDGKVVEYDPPGNLP